MKRVITKLWIGMLCSVSVLQFVLPVQAENTIEEPDNLYALSACLMDAESGRILFGKEEETRRANASTTKIMTLILTLENADLNEIVTISDYASRQPDVQLHAKKDEQFCLRDLCYSLMLESHNDTAVAIAEHVAGSVEAFTAKMNEKAAEIGCTDTYFLTPNGLDEKDEKGFHGTTASDLARILSYCILRSPKAAEFLAITQTPSYSFSNIEGTRQFSCNNHNAFLGMMDGALTGKTGFTGDAGYCYVGALKRDERIFVVALLGCGWPNNKGYKWSDTKKLMQYGIDNYKRVELAEFPIPEEACKKIPVSDAKTVFIGGTEYAGTAVDKPQAEDVQTVLLRSDEKLIVECVRKEALEAPVSQGQNIGSVRYLLNGIVLREDNIRVTEAIECSDFSWKLRQIWQYYLL